LSVNLELFLANTCIRWDFGRREGESHAAAGFHCIPLIVSCHLKMFAHEKMFGRAAGDNSTTLFNPITLIRYRYSWDFLDIPSTEKEWPVLEDQSTLTVTTCRLKYDHATSWLGHEYRIHQSVGGKRRGGTPEMTLGSGL
jgi:hypothetical protein